MDTRMYNIRKTEMVRSRLENGGLQNSSSGYSVGVDRFQEKAMAPKE